MPFTPLELGSSADPIAPPTVQQLADLLTCGALDLGLLNGILKVIADRVDAIDAADNAIVGATYTSATNVLTFTMADGPAVNIDMAGLLADAVATGIIVNSSYNAATNILTLVTANGDNIPIDMTGVISDAIATAMGPPQYSILPWYPPSPTTPVPAGWALCDGTNGTPNWGGRMPIGASLAFPFGSVGGADSHDHGGVTGGTAIDASQMPEHSHLMLADVTSDTPATGSSSIAVRTTNSPGEEEYEMTSAGATTPTIGITSAAGGSGGTAAVHDHSVSASSSMPPYASCLFIMKL